MVLTPMFCAFDISYAPCAFGLRYTYLHQCGITKTTSGVGERVADAEVSALATFLVVDTKDHEALVGDGVDKVLALYNNRVGGSNSRRERAESCEVACELDEN